MSMRPQVLKAILDGALAAGAVASAGCGCIMGRAYGPSAHVLVAQPPPELLKSAVPDQEGKLDERTCLAVCGDEVQTCELAKAHLTLPAKPPPARRMSCRCDNHDGKGRFEKSREVSEEEASSLHPDAEGNLELQRCFEWECCGKDVALVWCRLDAAQPGTPEKAWEEDVVVCHTLTPGGCDMSFGHGRAPPGLDPTRVDTAGIGGFFARAAHMEQASVRAFGILAKELTEAGAPKGLVTRAKRSAREERRHARITSSLARSFGAKLERPRVRATKARSLFQVARENAVEGCVRETFGALVAMFQASAASNARVRENMREIARDEVRHAALAWDVHGWCLSRLGPSERRRIRAAMQDAAKSLTITNLPESVRDAIGLPNQDSSQRMIDALRIQLWQTDSVQPAEYRGRRT